MLYNVVSKPHTVYVQATSKGVNARASEPLPSAISFVPGVQIICRTTDLRVDLTGVYPEGTILVAYRNLKAAYGTRHSGLKYSSDIWPAYGVRHKRLNMAEYVCIFSTVLKGENACKAERLQPYMATLEALLWYSASKPWSTSRSSAIDAATFQSVIADSMTVLYCQ